MNIKPMQKISLYIAATFAVLCTFTLQPAVAADAAKKTAQPKITFDDHVRPVLRQRCGLCHNADKAKGGLNLDTYTNMMAGGSSGEVVEPGDIDSSRLWALINHEDTPQMPPKQPKMPKAELTLIKNWINAGALENSGSKAKVKKKSSLALTTSAGNKPTGPAAMPEGLLRQPVIFTKRVGAVSSIASSPWAPLIAVAGQKQISLYHSETRKLLGVLPFLDGIPHILKFSRNGSLLLAGGGRGSKRGIVALYDVKTGKRIMTLGDELDIVMAADINNDHTLVALGGPQKVVRVYSTADGSLQHEIKKHTDWISSIEFSPDGVLLATADRTGGMFVWESDTAREYLALKGHRGGITDISWRSDSNILASGSKDATVKLWEMNDGKAIRSWTGHAGGVTSVEYAPNGNIATAGRDRYAKAWDGNGKAIRTAGPLVDIALVSTLSYNGSKLIAGDWRGNVRMWDVAKGKELGTLTPNPPTIEMRLQAVIAQATKVKAAWTAANNGFTTAQNFLTEKAKLVQTATVAVQQGKTAVTAANSAVSQMNQEIGKLTIQLDAKVKEYFAVKALISKNEMASNECSRNISNGKRAIVSLDTELKRLATEKGKFIAKENEFTLLISKITIKLKNAKADAALKAKQHEQATAEVNAAKAAYEKAPADKKAEMKKVYVQKVNAENLAIKNRLAADSNIQKVINEQNSAVSDKKEQTTSAATFAAVEVKTNALKAKVQKEIIDAEKKKAALTEKIKQDNLKTARINNEVIELRTKIAELKKQLAVKQTALTAATSKMGPLQAALTKQIAAKTAAEKDMLTKQQAATLLKTQLTSAEQHKVQLDAEKKAWDELPAKLKQTELALQSQVAQSQKAAEALTQEYANVAKTTAAQQAKMKETQAKIAALQAELAKNQTTLATSQKALGDKQAALAAAKAAAEKKAAMALQVKQQKEELEARLKLQEATKK